MKKYYRNKIYYETTFVIGFILLFAQIPFIAKTLIDIITPIIIVLGTGVLAYFIDYKNYSDLYEYNDTKNRYLYPFMHFSASYGGIILFLFISLNYYLSDNIETKTEYNVIDRGIYNVKNSSDKKLYFIINYNENNKEISFDKCDYKTAEKELYKTDKIELTTRKGLLGYDILVEKKRIKR